MKISAIHAFLSGLLLWLMLPSAATADDDYRKAVVNVITYDAEGNVLQSGYGFYLTAQGTAVAPYHIFKDAVRADVINNKGKKAAVLRILGANSTYDLVKFSVDVKETTFLPLTETPAGDADALYLVNYSTSKKQEPVYANVTTVTPFDGYNYYDISAANSDINVGCPLVDATGHAVAVIQKNVGKNATTACAIDSRFINGLEITTTSIFNADLRDIAIPKGLPATESDALSYIYMLGHRDSMLTLTAIGDFMATYPDNGEIYAERASFYADHGRYDLAEQDYATALEKSTKKDEVHLAFSKTIFNQVSSRPEQPYKDWSMAKAIEEVDKAYALNPAPLYLMQRARYRFANKEYQESYDDFMQVNSSELASAETFYSAAMALEMTGTDSLRVLTLLDSAINRLPEPYTQTAAQYFLERATRRIRAARFREAVFDYNEYEQIIGPKNLNDNFYYLREQAELQGRMYQQALDDIQTAIGLNPNEVIYRVEEALIYVEVGMYEEAIAAARKALEKMPENADALKLIGIALGEQGKKTEALEYLNKAKAQGDTSVDVFLKKYE